jgi:N-acetylglucosamine repressor
METDINTTLVEKRRNIRSNIVFNCIKKNNSRLSRKDIVRHTHYSMTTISAIVDDLIIKGIVKEAESCDNRVGRRPVLLSINDDSMYFAGLECSATVMTITVINCMDTVAYQDSLTLNEPMANDFLLAMEEILIRLSGLQPVLWSKIVNITIGLPGKFDSEKGIGIFFVNVKDWRNIDVKAYLSQRFSKAFYFAHNIDSMLLGYKAAKEVDENHSILFIALRSGIGARLYSIGTLMSEYGIACELGHLKARNANRLCSCGKRGCYETEVSIPALYNKIAEAIKVNKLASLRALYGGDTSKIELQDFYNVVEGDDAEALEVLKETASYIGELIATASMILTPDMVVLYSDLCQLGQPFTSVIDEIVHSLVSQSDKNDILIKYHPLELYLGAFGAALIGMRSYFYETSNVI